MRSRDMTFLAAHHFGLLASRAASPPTLTFLGPMTSRVLSHRHCEPTVSFLPESNRVVNREAPWVHCGTASLTVKTGMHHQSVHGHVDTAICLDVEDIIRRLLSSFASGRMSPGIVTVYTVQGEAAYSHDGDASSTPAWFLRL